MSYLPSSNRLVVDLSFTEDALEELTDCMSNKPNLVTLLEVLAERWAKLQEEAVRIPYVRMLDFAEGVLLDDIADELFLRRQGQSDESLRSQIKLNALKMTSKATRDDIVSILRILSGTEYVKVFKGDKNRVEVTFAHECLDLQVIPPEISQLFPVTTNLTLGNIVVGTTPIGVGDAFSEDNNVNLTGELGDVYDQSFKSNRVAEIVYSDEESIYG